MDAVILVLISFSSPNNNVTIFMIFNNKNKSYAWLSKKNLIRLAREKRISLFKINFYSCIIIEVLFLYKLVASLKSQESKRIRQWPINSITSRLII